MGNSNNFNKLISIITIVIPTWSILVQLLKKWENLYVSDMTRETLYIIPIICALAVIICAIGLVVIYFVLELRHDDYFVKNKQEIWEYKTKIYHLFNILILIYSIIFIICTVTVVWYEFVKEAKSIWDYIGLVLLGCIVIVGVIVGAVEGIKYIRRQKKKVKREMHLTTYLMMLGVVALISLFIFASIFPPESLICEGEVTFSKNGEINLELTSNKELFIKIMVNNNEVQCEYLDGNMKKKRGNSDRYYMVKEYFYNMETAIQGNLENEAVHMVIIEIQTEETSEVDSKEVIVLRNDFKLSGEKNYKFAKEKVKIQY